MKKMYRIMTDIMFPFIFIFGILLEIYFYILLEYKRWRLLCIKSGKDNGILVSNKELGKQTPKC